MARGTCLVGNKGYRKYLAASGKERFNIDEKKIKEESRYDGKWVLRTNRDAPAGEVAMKYKQLEMVEDIFRTMQSVLDTRPIYHTCTETIRGHVFCRVLALCKAYITKPKTPKPRRGKRGRRRKDDPYPTGANECPTDRQPLRLGFWPAGDRR